MIFSPSTRHGPLENLRCCSGEKSDFGFAPPRLYNPKRFSTVVRTGESRWLQAPALAATPCAASAIRTSVASGLGWLQPRKQSDVSMQIGPTPVGVSDSVGVGVGVFVPGTMERRQKFVAMPAHFRKASMKGTSDGRIYILTGCGKPARAKPRKDVKETCKLRNQAT